MQLAAVKNKERNHWQLKEYFLLIVLTTCLAAIPLIEPLPDGGY
jgi:hypothetical protein